MRFVISREFEYYDKKPLEDDRVVRGMIERWDVRTFKSPEEFDAKLVTGKTLGSSSSKPWLSEGTDHQIIYGPRGGARGIKRKKGMAECWFIEIANLEELMEIFDEHGYGGIQITISSIDRSTPEIQLPPNF